MDISDVIAKYRELLETKSNQTRNTRRAKLCDLNHFGRFFEKRELESVTEHDVRDYFDTLREEAHYSISTIVRIWSTVRTFFDFCVEEKICGNNPTAEIKAPPRPEPRVPEILTKGELRRLLAAPQKERKKLEIQKKKQTGDDNARIDEQIYNSVRNHALIELLFASGMRPGAIVKVKQNDINLGARTITIHTQKDVARIGYFPSEDVCRIVHHYIKISSEQQKTQMDDSEELPSQEEIVRDQPLFTYKNGSSLSEDAVRKIVHRYAEQANLKKAVTPFTLRHTMAVFLRKSGTDNHAVNRLLGIVT